MYHLFYSKNCKYSEQFINTLKKTGEDQFFKKVSVDTREGRNFAISKNITKVPAIIINDNTITGVEALKWLQAKVKGKTVSSMGTRQNKTTNNNVNTKNTSQPLSVGAYAPELTCDSAFGMGNYVESNHSSTFNHQLIMTPEEDPAFEKKTTEFRLVSDNITNGATEPPSSQNKASKFDMDFEKMKKQREMY